MPSVSAVVLTKNNQATIRECLIALRPAVDYVTVVDTGSEDETVTEAIDSGARVYHFGWRDDFAAARNFGDSVATTDWVLHVDSDEILRREDVAKIRKACSMFRKPEKPVTMLVQIISSASGRVSSQPASRMYKRNSFVWKGIVHEQLFHKRTDDCLLVETDIGFRHSGYDPDVVNTASKYLRNIELLEKGIEQEPMNQFYHFFLGRDYSLVGRHIEALPHLIRATKLLTNENIQYQKRVYSTLAECQQVLGDHDGLRRTVAVMKVQFGDEHHLH